MHMSHKLVYALYLLIWIIMAINPKYPQAWLLENVLVFIFVPFIIWMDKKHNYTLLSIIFLLIFASLHSLGSHYTYAEMEHFNTLTDFFGFERNHFDRLVHCLFGLLAFRMLFEMSAPGTANVRTALLLTFTMIISISAFYEILEWIAVILLHPELSMAFLGIQGDIWDAQKDTIAASIGALINIVFYKSYTQLWLSKRV